ncbi:MAG: beta-propeller fold lactonase family protein [Planctomycetes bacterium]|nr:beta-propeller fold lactonase family protein [Planctomycetota bacterium]
MKNYPCWLSLPALLLAACGGGGGGGAAAKPLVQLLNTSGMIQLSPSGKYAYVLNKNATPSLSTTAGSVTIVRVKNDAGADVQQVVTEIAVGRDPFSLTVTPDGKRLFVANSQDNTVSVLELGAVGDGPYVRLADILVGAEPRATAELGASLYVSNYAEGTLTVIDTKTLSRTATIDLVKGSTRIQNPFALAALPDGRLWVGDFFCRAIPGKTVDQIEGFDDGKEARVAVLQNQTIEQIVTLAPVADAGFTADRTLFDTANGAVNDTFKAPAGVPANAVPQGAMFNQLFAFAFDEAGNRLYLPTIAAQPAPPVKFDVNVQALVGVIDVKTNAAVPALHRNLNVLIRDNFANEPAPVPPFVSNNLARLDRAFAADTTSAAIRNKVGAFLSRGGSFLMKATIGADGTLALAKDNRGAILRVPVTNVPGGVTLSNDGTRAYVASELVGQMTVVDLAGGTVLATVDTATTSTDATRQKELLGQLKFFTGMGIAADTAANTDARAIDTHRHRNMQSENNWSSCASCHPFGHADTMTWIFATGPRQTLSLDAFFAPGSTIENGVATTDQKISNWNAERQGSTEFNNNSRGVQGGHGFTNQALATIDAGLAANQVPDAGTIFNGSARLGASNALDFETQWIASLRAPNKPTNLVQADVDQGRALFGANCAACHGGTKWTRSTRFTNNFRWPDPAFVLNGANPPVAVSASNFLQVPNATTVAAFNADGIGAGANQFETLVIDTTVPNQTIDFNDPIELRGAGGTTGKVSAPLNSSFAIPSLFNARNTAPYGHHGRAQTLAAVFDARANGGLGHPTFGLSTADVAKVLEFVRSIDEATAIFP